MIILTNCLSDTDDEGSLKVANCLIPRLRQVEPGITVVSYGAQAAACDIQLRLNKLMLSGRLAGFLSRRREPILYITAYARMLPTTFRLCMLSLFSRGDIWVLLAMKSPFCRISRFLLRASGARVIALAEDSWQAYREVIAEKAVYLRTGVDTKRYVPVPDDYKRRLRRRYGIPADKPVVLHVGHMTQGRNVALLADIEEDFHVILAVSTKTRAQQDAKIRRRLEDRKNITILDDYLPSIEEIYQMADVYLFPVADENSCIDVPLSVLEAASCGLPVVTTPYGELRQLIDRDGFYHLNSFEPRCVNELLRQAIREGKNARESILAYDWALSAEKLMCIMRDEENL